MDLVVQLFSNVGYSFKTNPKLPNGLLWEPDYVFLKDKITFLVLSKTNNSILPAFLNRISKVPKGNYIPVILFAQKLKENDERSILNLGVSIGYMIKGRLELKIRKKRIANVVKKEIKKKIPSIDVFISSKQDIPERLKIKDTFNLLRETMFFPFMPPHLIEYDNFAMKDLKKHIRAVMGKCEWVTILLEENYSPIVSYELKIAITNFDHQNVFVFVKSTAECHEIWKREIKEIQELPSKTIKYYPFSDSYGLEVTLTRAVIERMKKIYKIQKINIYE